MLSTIACISQIVLAAWVILSYAPSSTPSILAMRVPRIRPNLRTWAAIIAILGADFAANAYFGRSIGVAVRLDLCDTAVIAALLFSMMQGETLPRDLWGLPFGVGLLGLMLTWMVL